MYIIFRNNKIKKICNDINKAKVKYSITIAKNIIKRLNSIRASENFQVFRSLKIYNCHKLKGDYKGSWALDLDTQFRLIFSLATDKNLNNINFEEVNGIIVEEITDYHG